MSDCIGFKYVLALDMIVVCVTSTSLSFIPTYSEGPAKIPFANVSTDDELIAIQWSVCANDQMDHTDLEPNTDNETPMMKAFELRRIMIKHSKQLMMKTKQMMVRRLSR